jgi:predicted nuclease of predicted toxin-antitoxin system
VRILFDECVPWPLRKVLTGHECRTAQQMGWKSIKNGELLALAEEHFDLFLTSDQNLAYQQNLAGRRIAILELSTNKLRRLQAAAAMIQAAVGTIQPGDFLRLQIL